MSSIFNTSVLSIGFMPSSLGSLPGFLISAIISFKVTSPTWSLSLSSFIPIASTLESISDIFLFSTSDSEYPSISNIFLHIS